jgi:hypothetical protein
MVNAGTVLSLADYLAIVVNGESSAFAPTKCSQVLVVARPGDVKKGSMRNAMSFISITYNLTVIVDR